ncbi:MAG: hypothetical protein ABR976_17880 [Terracidiphilus sp.]|jgi:isocitrate/isopropylmalate dehydrogenase
MAEQFENKEETRLEEDTATDATAQEKINRVANKAAEKSTKTVQHYDKENSVPFTK